MAYNTGARFPPLPKSYVILEPGGYQFEKPVKVKPTKVPFLSTSKRNTKPGARIWTHAIYYNAGLPLNIPNCASMMSKCPRFPYEAFSEEDIKAILCKCKQKVCGCSEDVEQEFKVKCQAKIRRSLFKGHPPRSEQPQGLSAPSKWDHGFEVLPDGTRKRIFTTVKETSPPFYNTKVIESTGFYHGWKWSKWKSSHASKTEEPRPGPADYTIERQPTELEISAERIRAQKRKTSKQLRFMEMIYQKNITEGLPGPALYSPKSPTGTDLQYFGPKAPRFQQTNDQRPSPADHWLRRDFNVPAPPDYPCHVKLPDPPFFGVKAQRFKPQKEEGPSPATYSPNFKECHVIQCPTAAFGCSTERFKAAPIDDEDEVKYQYKKGNNERCYMPTWGFKSKTIRIKPLVKQLKQTSPADFSQQNVLVERTAPLQYAAPFYSSEGRFEPWKNWMTVHGELRTPGPGYYNLENSSYMPAVCRGPLIRSKRFSSKAFQSPGPSKYRIGGGVETILNTHNQILKNNINNQHKFHWEPPVESKQLTFEEREALLLHKSIALLEVEDGSVEKQVPASPVIQEHNKSKLLRYFIYSHLMKTCI